MNRAIESTLQERRATHGDYADHAKITQKLKAEMRRGPSWAKCDYMQQEALEMIVHKIGRILAGSPDFHDHWHDIAGYATLIADRLGTTDDSPQAVVSEKRPS